MKKLSIILLIALIVGGCGGKPIRKTANKPVVTIPMIEDSVKEEFHVRVKMLGSYCDAWYIEFTNDNFIMVEQINETFDMSRDYGYASKVVMQEKIFNTESEAISAAKKFKSYKICSDYNSFIKKRYDKLVEYRTAHPVKPPIDEGRIGPQCEPNKTTNVY